MKFSVLIAAYNAVKFMPTALASLRSQIHQDWELIVVEDGSNDGTEGVVRRFSDECRQAVRYENLGVNRGVAVARNRLLALAEADAIAFLDADDVWSPAHLESLAAELGRGHALAITGIELWDSQEDRTLGIYFPSKECLVNPRRSLLFNSFIHTSSCVALPLSVVSKTGYFDESLQIGEDRDYWFRALDGGGTIGCAPGATCRYTKHAASSMTRTLRVAEDTVRFHQKHFHASDFSRFESRRLLASARRVYGRLLRKKIQLRPKLNSGERGGCGR